MAFSIITLTTDFGQADGYVGTMKGVMLARAPQARLVDLSHEIAPQDVLAGAFVLARAYRYFPPETIHVAVIDPGVGTSRRALLLETAQGRFIGPDNGLFSLVLRETVALATGWAGGRAARAEGEDAATVVPASRFPQAAETRERGVAEREWPNPVAARERPPGVRVRRRWSRRPGSRKGRSARATSGSERAEARTRPALRAAGRSPQGRPSGSGAALPEGPADVPALWHPGFDLSAALRSAPAERLPRAYVLNNPIYWLEGPGATFHGRDVFAPVAAHLAAGEPPERLGTPIPLESLALLPDLTPTLHANAVEGRVIAVDRFGNLITNIAAGLLSALGSLEALEVRLGALRLVGVQSAYGAVPAGEPLALINSAGLLEIAVTNGNAAQSFQAGVGAAVHCRPAY